MAISPRLRGHLERHNVAFDEVAHSPCAQAAQAAEAAHLLHRSVAKSVLIRTPDEYMLAVVPSSRKVEFGALQRWLGRDVSLAAEMESVTLFPDCELGALPPVGEAFGLETILDDALLDNDDIYFEGGDHRTLVHLKGDEWRRLVRRSGHCAFSA
jgi:Ala-tRNA(Pro) deacylase